MAPPRGDHVRDEGMHPVDDALHVDRPESLPVSGFHLPDRAADAHPGIVEHQIHPAEQPQRGLGQSAQLFGVGDVGGDSGGVVADRFGRRGQRVGVDIGQHHVQAAVVQGLGDRAPDPTCGPGDHGDLSGFQFHGVPFGVAIRSGVSEVVARSKRVTSSAAVASMSPDGSSA